MMKKCKVSKLSIEDQKQLIPDEDIRRIFIQREDIAALSPDEQELRWQAHLKNINQLRASLSGLTSIVILENKEANL